jgi:hypothetical protein
MPDDITRRQPEDPQRINIEQDWEVSYWSEKLGCTKAELIAAVQKVGPMVEDVKKELGK